MRGDWRGHKSGLFILTLFSRSKLMSLLCLSLILTTTNCILSFANLQILLGGSLVGLILLNILLLVSLTLGLPANVKHLRNSLVISVVSWVVQDVVVVMQFLQSKLYIELIGCFVQLVIVFITAYQVYFIWQLWKQVRTRLFTFTTFFWHK